MGTRNLTVIKMGGKVKVAQYCQWDGYPSGVGAALARTLKTLDLSKFKKALMDVRFLTQKEFIEKTKRLLVMNPAS